MKQGTVYKIFGWYFVETNGISPCDKHTTAETHQESCGTTRPDTFPRRDTRLWYLKVNVVKEEEYPREYRGRCLAGRARSRCQRSRDEVPVALRLQKKLFRLSQSDSSDTRSSSPISRGHSADRALQIDQSDREWGAQRDSREEKACLCLFITVSTTDGLKGRQKAPADLRVRDEKPVLVVPVARSASTTGVFLFFAFSLAASSSIPHSSTYHSGSSPTLFFIGTNFSFSPCGSNFAASSYSESHL
ncbi:hypothetical protein G5I_00642 [Acromyrmex echinatior]|uniref:Uncharacterized protein n=1 Tax=Acromyrmex echinatior TaxID=103372 RepID=F4W5E5_ACREC|nr:hypothetical protein G5I_00642 [Acromyrmex echinatior]